MTFRELAPAIALLALTGCANDLDWTLIASGRQSITGQFLWRNDRELWTFGGAAVARRVDGQWEQLEMCGEGHTGRVTLAFDGDDVWALCGDGFGAGQELVHYAGEEGTFVSVPFDGRLVLATMIEGIVLAGETSLHRYEGGEWVAFAPAPPVEAGGLSYCTGRSETEIYCGSFYAVTYHWDGSAWNATDVIANIAPEIRAGDIWLGAGRFVGGAYESLAGETERPVSPITIVPPSTVIWAGGTTEALYLWRGPVGGGPSEFLGGAPAVPSVGGGGTSGGSNSLYAIDAGTFLMINSTTSISGSGSSVWEGRL